MKHWRPSEIPSLAGKFAVITGEQRDRPVGRTGTGAVRVVLACRDVIKGETAKKGILHAAPGASVEVAPLDLADLASVRDFARKFGEQNQTLDLLINNAGIMMPPRRKLTADGFELTFGTNHLGHLALTALLLPAVLRAGGRVVTVSSIAHQKAVIDFDDLQAEKRYSPWKAYAQSKLANLMFALELDRRLRAASSPAVSIPVHPGVASTGLFVNGPGAPLGPFAGIINAGIRLVGQSEDRGAFPTLFAATSPDAVGGKFYGPDGLFEYSGFPVEVRPRPQAMDEAVAAKLWAVSEQLTGVQFDFSTAGQS